jgi:hypothetical protein
MDQNFTDDCRAERRAVNEGPQRRFIVTARDARGSSSYSTIGTDSAAVLIAALDLFGICAVTVKPARAAE